MQNDSYSLSLARPYVSITSIVIFPSYHYHLLQILNYHFSVELPIDVSNRDQTIWEILEFCYRHQILGLIYRIRADAHGILVFTC